MEKETFLVEIGTEELPPKLLRQLAESFMGNLEKKIQEAHLHYDKVFWYASPRRLAVKITALELRQADQQIEKRGPAVKSAFNEQGEPTKAALGWAHSNGIEITQAERLQTDKGEWLVINQLVKGKKSVDLLVEMVRDALARLPITRAMRWGAYSTLFIRPVHTVTLLLGEQLIEGEILGIKSDRRLQCHRFMASDSHLVLEHADQYPELLWKKGAVQADYQLRKEQIKKDIEEAATKIGGIADLDDDLLEEVTSLVEYPVVLTASFEERFLEVPAEALVYTMKGDQKYFPVYDVHGALLPKFIFVSNIESKEPHWVIEGNEKVVRPRLSDAEFFFNADKKQTLESYLPRLETVLFQKQLGSVKDKTDRMVQLAHHIAKQIGVDPVQAERAALLSKCDLLTTMVFEFTDTQGIMGMHYARLDGEEEAVALAIKEHYQPKFSGDQLPTHGLSSTVALADRIDTLVGIFGIGQAPKGASDPFALRRAALGILRIMIDYRYSIDLAQLIDQSIELFGERLDSSIPKEQLKQQIFEFVYNRLKAFYQEKGYTTEQFQAVLARSPTKPYDFDLRMQAVAQFSRYPEAKALAEANKRVSNILSKAGDLTMSAIDMGLLDAPAELALAKHILSMQIELAQVWKQGEYAKGLTQLASLKQVTDDFFDQVMVMDEDPKIRENRLAILIQLRNLFLNVADISLLQ